jgi:hypothetical protein
MALATSIFIPARPRSCLVRGPGKDPNSYWLTGCAGRVQSKVILAVREAVNRDVSCQMSVCGHIDLAIDDHITMTLIYEAIDSKHQIVASPLLEVLTLDLKCSPALLTILRLAGKISTDDIGNSEFPSIRVNWRACHDYE